MFYGVASLGFAAAGWSAGLAWPFYLGLGLGLAQLAWQVARLAIDTPADCLAKFKSNHGFGLILFAAIVMGRIAAP